MERNKLFSLPLRGGRWWRRLPLRVSVTPTSQERGDLRLWARTMGFLAGSPRGFCTTARGLARPVFRHGARCPLTGFLRRFLGRLRPGIEAAHRPAAGLTSTRAKANDACQHSFLPSPMLYYDQEAPPHCFLRPAVIPDRAQLCFMTDKGILKSSQEKEVMSWPFQAARVSGWDKTLSTPQVCAHADRGWSRPGQE